MRLPVHTMLPAPRDRSFLLPLRQAIVAQVVGLFNDQSRGEKPVVRRDDGLFGPAAVAWRVHGDVTSMMIGGISGLLLQMLHPAVLAGVWDHPTSVPTCTVDCAARPVSSRSPPTVTGQRPRP